MYIDLEPLIFTELKRVLGDEDNPVIDSMNPKPTVATSYTEQESKYPFVVFYENSNSTIMDTKDSSGFNHCQVSYRVEIFTIGDLRRSQSKLLLRIIDDVMTKTFGLSRDMSDEIPNYRDKAIHRRNLLYSGIVGSDLTIYGR